jgi:anthranilate synthase/aminodeoxychorismate synthase-like glutamine amidotransferase
VILLIDNYDSFVHNLARYVRELGFNTEVRRNDALTVGEIAARPPSHVILSPGPCSPTESGVSVEVVRQLSGQVPILGICLGHQCIGAACGAPIVRAGRPVHGRTSAIAHRGSGVFSGLPSPFLAARYHSLVIARDAVPDCLEVLAVAEEDGEIMAVSHREHRTVGLQFHPESAATEFGYRLIDRFLRGEASEGARLPQWSDQSTHPIETAVSVRSPWTAGAARAFVPPPADLVR